MTIVDESVIDQCRKEVESVVDQHDLDQVKSKYLGNKSVVKEAFKRISSLEPEARLRASAAVNAIKKELGQIIFSRKEQLILLQTQKALEKDKVDTTLSADLWQGGVLHPLSKTMSEIKGLLYKLGFDIAFGPEAETFYYNFTALNTPRYHPAVTSQDTLYIDHPDQEDLLLRSHTSCVQIRMLENHKPPLRIFSPGRVFRADTPDATHSPCFMQCEGLLVDKKVTLSDLVAILRYVLEGFFGQSLKLRFRPSYFPFTEPSLECDIWFKNNWLEVLGCGMVHPNVLKNVGIDSSEYRGFAFGLGIDRLTMLRYQIEDIRCLYEGDQAFLQQGSDAC
ncbi:MAG: phenylalanine--tRNA ligase subunit alpha [Pseudomonadota bacterium]|nr:phenylalanine--tRNA ligase subunit alpha [Pseudomonadota bacterium]